MCQDHTEACQLCQANLRNTVKILSWRWWGLNAETEKERRGNGCLGVEF